MCKGNSIQTEVHFKKSLAFCYILKTLLMSKSSRKLQNYGIQGVSYYISIIYVCHLAQINVGELDPSCTVDVPFSQPVTGHKIYFSPSTLYFYSLMKSFQCP